MWLTERALVMWNNLADVAYPDALLKWSSKSLSNFTEEDCKDKVFVVTGANCGIGKAICLQLARRGAIVVLGCRNLETGQKALQEIQSETNSKGLHLLHLDLADFNSVRKFAQEISEKFQSLHVLINNAAYSYYKLERTVDGLEMHMTVNYLSPLLLTKLMLPLLEKSQGSRVVNVSSLNAVLSQGRSFIEDVNFEKRKDLGLMGTTPYNDSKLALCLLTKELAKRYPYLNFYSVNPGFVRTKIFDKATLISRLLIWSLFPLASISPLQASEGVLYLALCKECKEESGDFYHAFEKHRAVNQKITSSMSRELWNICHKLLDLPSDK